MCDEIRVCQYLLTKTVRSVEDMRYGNVTNYLSLNLPGMELTWINEQVSPGRGLIIALTIRLTPATDPNWVGSDAQFLVVGTKRPFQLKQQTTTRMTTSKATNNSIMSDKKTLVTLTSTFLLKFHFVDNIYLFNENSILVIVVSELLTNL